MYSLAENGEYGPLHDENICDRIVMGIRDTSLSEKLQLGADLTLVTAARQAKEVRRQQPLLHGETEGASGKKFDIPVGAVQAWWRKREAYPGTILSHNPVVH